MWKAATTIGCIKKVLRDKDDERNLIIQLGPNVNLDVLIKFTSFEIMGEKKRNHFNMLKTFMEGAGKKSYSEALLEGMKTGRIILRIPSQKKSRVIRFYHVEKVTEGIPFPIE